MLKSHYRCGDMIVLKSRMRGSVQPQGTGEIVAVLPETQGLVRYRVRLTGENFDRSVAEDDIDNEASTAGSPNTNADPQIGEEEPDVKTGSSWINISAVRTKK